MPPRPPRGDAGRFGSLTWARWSVTDDDEGVVVAAVFSSFPLLGGAPALWAPTGVVGAMCAVCSVLQEAAVVVVVGAAERDLERAWKGPGKRGVESENVVPGFGDHKLSTWLASGLPLSASECAVCKVPISHRACPMAAGLPVMVRRPGGFCLWRRSGTQTYDGCSKATALGRLPGPLE